MKKIFPLICVAFMALGMGSCTKNYNTYVTMNRQVIDIQVNQNEWGYSGASDNNYFVAEIKVPELTWDAYDNAVIKMYREYDHNTKFATQIELPYEREKEAVENGTAYYYQERVDYEYTQGVVRIFYTESDFHYENDLDFMPEAMHFRLVMLW